MTSLKYRLGVGIGDEDDAFDGKSVLHAIVDDTTKCEGEDETVELVDVPPFRHHSILTQGCYGSLCSMFSMLPA